MRGIFDIPAKEAELRRLEERSGAEAFWSLPPEERTPVLKDLRYLHGIVDEWKAFVADLANLESGVALCEEEAGAEPDAELLAEMAALSRDVEKRLHALELRNLLGGEHDQRGAIVTIHPGAGGTESADWAAMLLRMYQRWAESRGYRLEVVDYQPAEEAGIKSATFEVTGDYAFGHLKTEMGVHRLVRISPFDSNKRRHTSFASVFVYPDIEEDIVVDIKEGDLQIDTYRATGAGGQHVNTTDSAVRITHLPTGIVVQCQNERSQHKNRAMALKVLRARLYERQRAEMEAERDAMAAQKKEITWGSQIRSYVLHPYQMVKDHRTGHETGNTEAVLGGDIDGFIEQALLNKVA